MKNSSSLCAGNFAAQVQVEAVTGQFGLLYVDLRPESKKYPQVRGYAYREMEAPSLVIGKKASARGKKMLETEQITLAYAAPASRSNITATAKKSAKPGIFPTTRWLWLWVCGKGDRR